MGRIHEMQTPVMYTKSVMELPDRWKIMAIIEELDKVINQEYNRQIIHTAYDDESKQEHGLLIFYLKNNIDSAYFVMAKEEASAGFLAVMMNI
jgi:hypothetical protein